VSQAEPDDDHWAADAGDASRCPATFEEIVASWQAEGSVPRWPDEHTAEHTARPSEQPTTWQPRPKVPVVPADQVDEEHFVPPEPPPLPRLGPPVAVGLVLLVLGLLLLIAPQVVGLGDSVGLPLGLVTVSLGLGWLVLRAWHGQRPDEDDQYDDGAVI
jgi:hypothetical protein